MGFTGGSVSEFHNVVLTGGALPLTLRERRVEDWIEDKGGAART